MYKLVMNVYHWPDLTTRRRDSSSDARAEPTATQYRSRHRENTTSLCDPLDNWNINVKPDVDANSVITTELRFVTDEGESLLIGLTINPPASRMLMDSTADMLHLCSH